MLLMLMAMSSVVLLAMVFLRFRTDGETLIQSEKSSLPDRFNRKCSEYGGSSHLFAARPQSCTRNHSGRPGQNLSSALDVGLGSAGGVSCPFRKASF